MDSTSSSNGSPKGTEGGTLLVKPVRTAQRKPAKQGFWHQPQLLLNLSSVVFFCIGCLMILSSHRQNGTQVIMKYPADHGNLALSMVIRDGLKPVAQNPTSDHQNGPNGSMDGKIARVELSSYGNYVPLIEALTLAEPHPLPPAKVDTKDEEDSKRDESLTVKVFVGILSTCFSKLSQDRRLQIRQTWKGYALRRHENIDIKFILSQPSNDTLPAAVEMLTREAQEHDDIVIVKGLDTYKNLPKKLIGLMRYFMSIPEQYTHLLKTDDDCYVRMHKIFESLRSQDGGYMMRNLYMGCIENRGGFQPVRDHESKWYIPYKILSVDMASKIKGVKYLAGWGYVVSRDVVVHALGKVDLWHARKDQEPFWYPILDWEDVMMGMLVKDIITAPTEAIGFKAAWRACTNQTAVRHLDLDAPELFQGLHEQQLSGLWDKKTVQCSTGQFQAGDYAGWKEWRNSAAPPNQRV